MGRFFMGYLHPMPEGEEVFEKLWAPGVGDTVTNLEWKGIKNVGKDKGPENGGSEEYKGNY